ncbi:MAG TPA: hypothetical protein VH370_23740 [Humisphaera sp.]|jgi:hypothetical protein|nr:hypothetical protein [Humisphaera sp.]
MADYPQIRHVLSAILSTETGLSDEAARLMLLRALKNNDWTHLFEQELAQAFSMPDTPWSNLLFNDDYEGLQISKRVGGQKPCGKDPLGHNVSR